MPAAQPGTRSRADRSSFGAHQGREPVGNGQAAAGFRAVFAPGVAAVEGAAAGACVPVAAGACGAAIGVARRARLRAPARLRAGAFRAAFFFPPVLFTDLATARRPAALFFFFADFFAFFARFLAMADPPSKLRKTTIRDREADGSFNRRGRSSAG